MKTSTPKKSEQTAFLCYAQTLSARAADPAVHYAKAQHTAICGTAIGKRLPYLPSRLFGQPDAHRWCKACADRLGISIE